MDRDQLIKKYDSDRMMLLFVVGLNLANCLSLLMSENGSFLLSSIIPQYAIMIALGFFENSATMKYAIIIILALLPTLIFALAYFTSKKSCNWFLGCVFYFSADLMIFAYYLLETGFSMEFLPDCIVELIIFYCLAQGYIVGKKIKDAPQTKKNEKQLKAKEKEIKFEYDDELAKQNKTDKTWLMFLIFFGLLAIMFGLSSLLNAVITEENQILGAVLSYVIIAVIFSAYVYSAFRLAPYTNAISYCFYVDKNVLHKKNKLSESGDITLSEIQLIEEKASAYKCTYKSGSKIKKIVIPKCYKGIETFIKK